MLNYWKKFRASQLTIYFGAFVVLSIIVMAPVFILVTYMTRQPIAVPTKYGIPLLLAMITAGQVGNYFNFAIFLNIYFLFGGIFAMLALQFPRQSKPSQNCQYDLFHTDTLL